MTIYTLPNKRLFYPRRADAQMGGNVMVNRSPMNKAAKSVEFPGDMWVLRLEYGINYTVAERDEQRAFWHRFRGQAHLLRCWHVYHPVPRGTLRGTPTAAAAVEGANSLVITGSSGETLLEGDFLEVTLSDAGTQLIEVASASGTGTITIGLVAPVRKSVSAGATVVWNRPSANFLLTEAPFIPHEPIVSSGFTIEAVEFFA